MSGITIRICQILFLASIGLYLPHLAHAKTALRTGIFVFSEGEDASSTFDTIYFRNSGGRVVRIIHAWNGGCCKPASADEFHRKGETFHYFKSYRLTRKSKNIPGLLMCDSKAFIAMQRSKSDRPKSFTAASIEEDLKEAKPFPGCKR